VFLVETAEPGEVKARHFYEKGLLMIGRSIVVYAQPDRLVDARP
jgi:hypothetical protein